MRNLIFVNGTSNDDLGIDLAADGVTANDSEDVDTGPNELLNHPVVTAADVTDGTVDWTLEGLALHPLPARVLRQSVLRWLRQRRGAALPRLISTSPRTAGASQRGTTATATPPAAGDYVTMTATRRTFTGPFPGPITSVLHETSEFSPCQVAG